jgi:hypothetical protein
MSTGSANPLKEKRKTWNKLKTNILRSMDGYAKAHMKVGTLPMQIRLAKND